MLQFDAGAAGHTGRFYTGWAGGAGFIPAVECRHILYEQPGGKIADVHNHLRIAAAGSLGAKNPRPGPGKKGCIAAGHSSCKDSSGPWSTGVERMIWVQVLPSFWNCRISCSSCIMLPQLTLIRKVYSPVTW